MAFAKNLSIYLLTSSLIFAAWPPASVHAADSIDLVPPKQRNFWQQMGRDVVAPVRAPQIFLLGSVLTFTTFMLKDTNFQKQIARKRYLGGMSKYGYELGLVAPNFLYTVGMGVIGFAGNDPRAANNSLLMLRATAYTALLTSGIKELEVEQRPRRDGDRQSFPSGHASNAFAFAGVVQRNHGSLLGVPAFGMATLVGLSRMNDNAHYLHDVVFGATIGLSYAFGLDYEIVKGERPMVLVPSAGYKSFSLGLSQSF